MNLSLLSCITHSPPPMLHPIPWPTNVKISAHMSPSLVISFIPSMSSINVSLMLSFQSYHLFLWPAYVEDFTLSILLCIIIVLICLNLAGIIISLIGKGILLSILRLMGIKHNCEIHKISLLNEWILKRSLKFKVLSSFNKWGNCFREVKWYPQKPNN